MPTPIPRTLAARLRNPSRTKALAAACEITDPALFDALLSDAGVYSERLLSRGTHFRAKNQHPLLWTLLLRAPPDSAEANRIFAAMTSLKLDAPAVAPWVPEDLDVDALVSRCRRLRVLTLGARPLPPVHRLLPHPLHILDGQQRPGEPLEALSALGRLGWLELNGGSVDLSALSATSVKTIALKGGAWSLAGGPPATRIYLKDGDLRDGDLSGLPDTLRHLQIESVRGLQSLRGIGRLGRLEALRVHRAPELKSLGELGGCTSLRDLSLRDTAVDDLRPLADLPADRVLRLSGLGGVTDLSRLPPLRALRGGPTDPSVRLHGLPVSDLRGLPDGTGARTVCIEACPALRGLDGIDALGDLVWLHVHHCPRLSRLSALRSATGLGGVSLRGCGAVRRVGPLLKLPELLALDLHGTRIKRRDVPLAIRWQVSWARNADLEEIATREEPRPLAERRQIASLRRMLLSREAEQVAQGLALLEASEQPEWVRLLRQPVRHLRSRGRLEFDYPALPDGAILSAALLLQAPEADALAAIDTLYIAASRRGPPTMVCLSTLSRLPALEVLHVSHVKLARLGAPGGWPKLRSLRIEAVNGAVDLEPLAGAPLLEEVTLWLSPGQRVDPSVLDTLPVLKRLRHRHVRLDEERLRACGVEVRPV